jgi:hypothetical protein
MPLPRPAQAALQADAPPGESLRGRAARGAVLGAAAALLETLPDGRRPEGILRKIVEGAVLGAGAVIVGRFAGSSPAEPCAAPRPHPSNGSPAGGEPASRSHVPVQHPLRTDMQNGRAEPITTPVSPDVLRKLYLGASALSFSVLADSSLEHYRGGFYNRVMYIGPTVSALMLAASARAGATPRRQSRPRRVLYGAASLTGLIGTGFHLYNVSKREGGWRWVNVFYGAPVAAPMGITFAGLFGLASSSLARTGQRGQAPRLLGRPAGAVIGAAAAAGLLGTSAEAGMLHFRGAFQDPFMYIPVTVPPLAALALGTAALRPGGAAHSAARTLLWSTAAAGILGMGFHAYGIQRNMGGWRNWSQNLLQGPPLPAPPSFTGMALAGLAALELMKGDAHG